MEIAGKFRMSLPPPPVALPVGPLNPIEAMITGINTNTYLIGMSMILLNLGGRHLAPSLTAEQDKFFQNPWIRRAMLFVVIFVATRNVFTALWLSIGLVVFIGYLLNEHSSFYLFGEPIPLPKAAPPPPPTQGLSPEEQEIYRRLHEKIERGKPAEEKKEEESKDSKLIRWYKENMNAVQQVIN
jgi:hypothetical protein